jgi:hypothetical protein
MSTRESTRARSDDTSSRDESVLVNRGRGIRGARKLESRAGVAQLAERQPSKLNVAGSIPVSRSTFPITLDYKRASAKLRYPAAIDGVEWANGGASVTRKGG